MVRCTWDRPAVQADEQAPHPGAGPAQAAGYSAHMRVLKSTKSQMLSLLSTYTELGADRIVSTRR